MLRSKPLCRAVEQSGQPDQGRLGPRLEQWLQEGESDEEAAAAAELPPSEAAVTAAQSSRVASPGNNAVAPAAAPSSSADSAADSSKKPGADGSASADSTISSGTHDSPAHSAEDSTGSAAANSAAKHVGQTTDSARSSTGDGPTPPSSPDAGDGSTAMRGIVSSWHSSPRADTITSFSAGGPQAGVNGRMMSPYGKAPGSTYPLTDRKWQAPVSSGMPPPTGPRPAPVALIPADEDNGECWAC